MTWEELEYHIQRMTPEQKAAQVIFRDANDESNENIVDNLDLVDNNTIYNDPYPGTNILQDGKTQVWVMTN